MSWCFDIQFYPSNFLHIVCVTTTMLQVMSCSFVIYMYNRNNRIHSFDDNYQCEHSQTDVILIYQNWN